MDEPRLPLDGLPGLPALGLPTGLPDEPAPTTRAMPAVERSPELVFAEHARIAKRGHGLRRQLVLVAAVSLFSAALGSTATVAMLAPALTAIGSSTTAIGGSGASAIRVSTSGATASVAATTTTSSSDAIVAAVARVSSSVVTITTTISAGQGRRAVSGTGVGSGFVYTSSGYILTNTHVVEGASSVTVTLGDGRELPGTVVKTDSAADLAVVKVNASGLTAAPIGTSAGVQVGQTLIAIGSPLGDYTESVTVGVLSGEGRTITVADELTGQPRTLTHLFQTDAAINPGNSGGPVLDISGNVIGMATASASSAQGIGFAIPIDAAATLMSEAQLVA